jgi:uncharacterized SAM-binding protein YcdF (DUF218 family)
MAYITDQFWFFSMSRRRLHKKAPFSLLNNIRANKIVIIIISLCLLILLSYPIWLPWIGEFLVVRDTLKEADVIVILAGDENERIADGAKLFQQGFASWFVLTDMRLDIPDSEGYYSNNVKQKAVEQGVLEERILLVPGQVSTTDEEATYLKQFITSNGFDSLIVVTSPFHTRRAQLILKEAFNDDVILTMYPAISRKYSAESWWKNPVDRRETFLEYVKILAHLVGFKGYDDCSIPQCDWLVKWLSQDSAE